MALILPHPRRRLKWSRIPPTLPGIFHSRSCEALAGGCIPGFHPRPGPGVWFGFLALLKNVPATFFVLPDCCFPAKRLARPPCQGEDGGMVTGNQSPRGITVLKPMTMLLLILGSWLATEVSAQPPAKSRLEGYVGGPYKVLVSDFTADRHLDILIGYRNLGVVSLAAGNGKGEFSSPVRNIFADEERRIFPDDASWSEPHVHNLAQADLDADGRPDIVCSIGGLSQQKRGRILVARNLGGGKFQPMVQYLVPSQAKGVRFADMDQDGRLDLLYTARGSGYKNDLTIGRLYIRAGLGPWKFGPARQLPAGKSAYYVEVADLNNDHFPDVLIPNEHDSCVTYFLNPGKKVFQDDATMLPRQLNATRIPNRRSHAVNDVRAVDLDDDGNQDVLTANLGTSTVSVFLGNGDGTFRKDTLLDSGKNGAFLGIGDFDRDGDPDFVITHWTEDFASVFLNRGDGTFTAREDHRTGLGNYGVDVADVNHDGNPDIVTANYRERSLSILFGTGKGSFKPAITSTMGLRVLQGKWLPLSDK